MPVTKPYKFAILSYYYNFRTLLAELNDSQEYEIDNFNVDYSCEDLGISNILNKGYDIVLVYSSFFNSLKNAGYCAIQIQKTDIDVIQAIFEAKKSSKNIALTAHDSENINVALLEKICDVNILIIKYSNVKELEVKLNYAINSGYNTIVGGGFSSEIVQDKQNINTFPVKPSTYSIKVALNRAKIIAQLKREDQLHHEQLLSILRLYNEGVIFIDENESCIYSNAAAAKLLSPTRIPLKDSDFHEYYENLFLKQALNSGLAITDKIVTINKRQLIINVIPFATDSRSHGAVAFIRDLDSLYDFAGRIRESKRQHGFVAHSQVTDILGQSRAIQTLREQITTYAPHDAAVLIYGETGTGKDLVAQAIHNSSKRKNAPFLAINCAAIPETLLESELFGYEEGAFTGARRNGKPGVFEMAHGGTLFLDEVGDLSYSTQLRLLRVLESHEVIRVGGSHIIPVDIRIISASHKSLPKLVQGGQFRADLFYRLACLRLRVPSLSQRIEDIPILLTPLLKQYGKTQDIIDSEILKKLSNHRWPGNIRELRSVFESYIILLGDKNKSDHNLLATILNEWSEEKINDNQDNIEFYNSGTLKDRIDEIRKKIVYDTVVSCSWNKQQAAQELGISYNTLWRILNETTEHE